MNLSEEKKQKLLAMPKKELIQEYMNCLERTGKVWLTVRKKVEKVEGV